MEDADKKPRSPQYPFIPLERCIVRAREFEDQFGANAGRVANTVRVWGYGEKSSGGLQTIAALSAFGLMSDEGAGESRKLKLTPLAMTILKDKRGNAAEEAIKTAALTPKVISQLWNGWGPKRPPDSESISTLHLDMKFTDEGAEKFLRIYDSTIAFAKLAPPDKPEDNGEEGNDGDEIDDSDKEKLVEKPPVVAKPGKVPLMANERILFTHEVGPNQGFRIVVTGEVDSAMADALKAFAEFQHKLAPKAAPAQEKSGDKPS